MQERFTRRLDGFQRYFVRAARIGNPETALMHKQAEIKHDGKLQPKTRPSAGNTEDEMIEIRLSFEENLLNHIGGIDATRFLLDMLANDPKFTIKAADEVVVTGPWGKVTERRE